MAIQPVALVLVKEVVDQVAAEAVRAAVVEDKVAEAKVVEALEMGHQDPYHLE